MTILEQYKELKKQWSTAQTDDEYEMLGKKVVNFRDNNFSKEDWEELIAQSSGREKYEYKRMMSAKFPHQSEDSVMIKDGTHFTKCTDEQKEWAKQFDESGTKYYEEIWGNPKKYCLELSDPIWRDGRWEDVEW